MARGEQPYAGTARELLLSWLTFQRETLAMKCDGLDTAALADQAAPPSTLSLARLLRHMAEMERMDALILSGQPVTSLYEQSEEDAGDDEGAAPDAGMYDWALYDVDDDALTVWREQCAAFDSAVQTLGSLDATAPGEYSVLTVRSLVLSLTMEYARHNGHADILRQRLDGSVGY